MKATKRTKPRSFRVWLQKGMQSRMQQRRVLLGALYRFSPYQEIIEGGEAESATLTFDPPPKPKRKRQKSARP